MNQYDTKLITYSSPAPPPAYDETPPIDHQSSSLYFLKIDTDPRFAEDLQHEEQERIRAQVATDEEFARNLMDEEERVNDGDRKSVV